MIPNITRGTSFHGVIKYLVGPGKANEHTNPHVVAGSAVVVGRAGSSTIDAATATAVADLLAEPVRRREAGPPSIGSVWHCSLAIKADDGPLGDDVWQQVAHDFMAKMGFVDQASGQATMPWVAIHHGLSKNGNDHIHLVVSMVHDNGTVVNVRQDYSRAQQACRMMETELELAPVTGELLGIGRRGLTPAEHAKQARTGVEPERRTLERIVRAAAAEANSETEFIARLRAEHVTVAPYFKAGGRQVTGYKVRLRDGDRWFGGGKLARDLTLPRLRDGWPVAGDFDPAALAAWRGTHRANAAPAMAEPVTDQQITAAIGLIDQASKAAAATGDLASWAAVSHDMAGVLAAASRAAEPDGPGPLARAAAAASQLGQMHRKQLAAAPRPRTRLTGAARVARALGRTRGRAGSIAFMRQLVTTLYALAQAAQALRQARIAEALLESARTDLAPLATPATPTTITPGSPRQTSPTPATVTRRTRLQTAIASDRGR